MNAVGIKKILYVDPSKVTADLTTTLAKALIADTAAKEVTNVHGETWQLEESEAGVTGYKNQLTGQNYRFDTTMGDITPSFSIGEYDYETKAALLGGSVIEGATAGTKAGWKRASGKVIIYKCLMCLTEDDVWFIFPKTRIVSRESETDKAVAIAVKGLVQEPSTAGVSMEYNFDASALV